MKKLLSAICIVSLLLTTALYTETTPEIPDDYDYDNTRAVDIFDVLDVLKDIIELTPEPLPVEIYDINNNGTVEIFDALEMLKCLVGMRDEPVLMPAVEMPMCTCGEEKAIWGGSIDDHFRGDSVAVVLAHCISIRDNRDWTLRDFKGIEGAVEIVVLSRLSDWEWKMIQLGRGDETLVNWQQYNRILSIRLDRNCKENVVRIVRQLEQLDFVVSAGPRYIPRPE